MLYNFLDTNVCGIFIEESDEKPPIKKSRFNLEEKHVPREEDEGKWALPEELAEFFAGYTKKQYTDKYMKKFMSLYPAPSNLNCLPRLDESAKKLLKDKNLHQASELDDEFATIQDKIQDVMGPLGAAWGVMKLCKAKELALTEKYVEDLVDQLQKAVIMVGNSMQKVS